MSTTEPPRKNTQSQLRAMAGREGSLPSSLTSIFVLRETGGIDPIPVPNPRSFTKSSAQAAEWLRLKGSSADVMHMLAAANLSGRTTVTANEWDPTPGTGSIPASSVSLTGLGLTHNMALVSRTSYDASINQIATTMANAPLGTPLRVRAQSAHPYLSFAIALGMDTDPDRYEVTAMVMDIVCGWVSVTVQQLKHRQRVPRAYDAPFNLPILPLTAKPQFTAYPGGHGAIGYALADVLTEVTGAQLAEQAKLRDLASKITINRERAGLHCEIDSDTGRDLGQAMAGWATGATVLASPDMPYWSALFAEAAKEWRP
jgi:hypothetical protein